MIRVAFAGPRGVGKSTLALHLERQYEVSRCSLAAPIKEIIRHVPANAYDRMANLWGWAEALYPPSLVLQAKFVSRSAALLRQEQDPGILAQIIGTEIGRALDDLVWIRYLLAHLPPGDCVVDDVRFSNEARALREARFTVIRLRAPEEVLADRLERRTGERRDPNHPSEHGLDGLPDQWWDAVWDTSEPLEITLSRLDRLVETLSRRAG